MNEYGTFFKVPGSVSKSNVMMKAKDLFHHRMDFKFK